MPIFKKLKGSQKEHAESSVRVQTELPTILSSVLSRLEKLERRVEALEETIVGAMGFAPRALPPKVRERSQKRRKPLARELKKRELRMPTPKAKVPRPAETKPAEKTEPTKIVRGKPIRPFKKED